MLFFLPGESVATFGGEDVGGRVKGIMSLIERNL